MKILTPEKRKALDEKRKRLHHTAAQFKTEFGELNAVIDRLTEIMGSWYLMPLKMKTMKEEYISSY